MAGEQKVIYASEGDPGQGYDALGKLLAEDTSKKIFLVCGRSLERTEAGTFFAGLSKSHGLEVIRFSYFEPNPLYESVVKGVDMYNKSGCRTIVAAGGGSAMDVAKCIKLFATMDPTENYLHQKAEDNDIRLIAVPTTAGTGSEATRFAVIYYQGDKQSVSHESLIPSAVFFDPKLLRTLPEKQRKATMLDALCHGIESYWSMRSTEESRGYARDAIKMVVDHMEGYLANMEDDNAAMQQAAYLAGKAINISQTTAGHAMCYKITGRYGVPHGTAAALCVSALWPFMIAHTEKCRDERGKDHLETIMIGIADSMGYDSTSEAAAFFRGLTDDIMVCDPADITDKDIEYLTASVNTERLANHPLILDEEDIRILYKKILKKE